MDSGVTQVRSAGRRPPELNCFLRAAQVRALIQEIQIALLHAHYASGYGTLGRLARIHPNLLPVWGGAVFEFPRRAARHARILKAKIYCSHVEMQGERDS